MTGHDLPKARVHALAALAYTADVVANLDSDVPDDGDRREFDVAWRVTRQRCEELRVALRG